jgi:hypothetical protein
MTKPAVDVDEMLKKMAAEAVKQGENLRAGVRDLTLRAFQTRELSLGQIRNVLRSVTEGVSAGATKAKIDLEKPLADALAGMDDALLKAVQASEIALNQLTDHGVDFKDSKVKKALNDLEKLEDEFLKTVREAANEAGKPIRTQWAAVLAQVPPGGTEAGVQADAVIDSFAEQMRTAVRRQREANLKAAHLLTQNFATLASGVLIGMSEGLQRSKDAPAKDRGA